MFEEMIFKDVFGLDNYIRFIKCVYENILKLHDSFVYFGY